MPDDLTVELVHRDDLHAYNLRMVRDKHRFIYSMAPDPEQPDHYRVVLAPRTELETRSA